MPKYCACGLATGGSSSSWHCNTGRAVAGYKPQTGAGWVGIAGCTGRQHDKSK